MRQLFTLCLLMILPMAVLAQNNAAPESQPTQAESMKQEVKEVIAHHLPDSHDFVFLSDREGNNYGIHLPVILYDKVNGLDIFSSGQFDYGNSLAKRGDTYYKSYHGKIYKTDAAGTLNFNEHGFPSNEKPLDFSITKNVVMIILTGLLMLWIFTSLARSYTKNKGIPTGIGRFFEPIVLYVKDEIAIPNVGEKHYKRFLPYLLTIFFLIWILNMFSLTPLGTNVTGNIAVTTALAILTFIITNVSGNKTYWGHVFNPLGDSMPWYGKLPLYIILIPIEILGLFIKPFSLLIRLFANMSAGHVVLMSLIGLIFIFQSWLGGSLSFLLTFVIILIKVLVALIQAYIFTMLSALYFGFAVEEPEAEGVQ